MKEPKGNNKKRNRKEIRNAFVMLCVAVAMMSTATYAWFTMTDSPTVQGLKMTAASSGGLELSDADEAWNNSITVETTSKILSPVSTIGNTDKFGSPVYSGNQVNSVTEITDETELKEKYVAVYDYKIRALGATETSPVKVGLLGGDGSGSNPTGSFIIREDKKNATQQAAYAIRVGFKIDNTWAIYEPNSDGTSDGNKALNGYTAGSSSTVKQKAGSGDFTSDTGSGNISKAIFELKDTNEHNIKMYVWLEGTDEQCVNELQTDTLTGQIQFTVIR